MFSIDSTPKARLTSLTSPLPGAKRPSFHPRFIVVCFRGGKRRLGVGPGWKWRTRMETQKRTEGDGEGGMAEARILDGEILARGGDTGG